MKIELEHLLLDSLKNNINLFLGSGFSVLAQNIDGATFPVGSMLSNELIKLFNLPLGLQLPQISTILENTRKNEFHSFLKQRFNVNEFSEKYNVINQLPIKSIFTTNIDNLVHNIFHKSNRFYLNDITSFGPSQNEKVAIDYVPLHGCILNDERKLIFNTVDIASAFINEQNVWQFLRNSVEKFATIFWGYSLNDTGVIQALFANPNYLKTHKPKWIILVEEDEASIAYFKAYGFNIIIATTESFLDYINSHLSETNNSATNKKKLINVTSEVFAKESIPAKSPKLPVRPLKYFYLGDAPFWSDIYSNSIPKLKHYEETLNLISSKKNLILLGIPASGKTTLMMQLAASINFNGHKLICTDINIEKAKLIVTRLLDEPALIFIDNFTDCMEAFEYFLKKKNIQLVGVDRQHNYETVLHRIDANAFNIHECTTLTERDAQIIYDSLPQDIKRDRLIYNIPNNDLSIFDFINLNIKQAKINERYINVLYELEKKNPLMLEFLVLSCYVNSCRTPVSFDMTSFYFQDDVTDYSDIYSIIQGLGKLINEYGGSLVNDDQDYFMPRSTILSETILRQVSSDVFRRVFHKFHNNVPKYAICRFDIFRKNAYDADHVRKAYPKWKEGKDFYLSIMNNDNSPFILQQGALYLASKKQYDEAFVWIDQALRNSRKNFFTIKNTHAIILFEANINSSQVNSVRGFIDESMEILSQCYNDDQRKTYHTTTYARQAIQYYTVFGDAKATQYINTAYKWLNDELRNNSWNRDLRFYLSKISPLITHKK